MIPTDLIIIHIFDILFLNNFSKNIVILIKVYKFSKNLKKRFLICLNKFKIFLYF
jgi:hypothetical protein